MIFQFGLAPLRNPLYFSILPILVIVSTIVCNSDHS